MGAIRLTSLLLAEETGRVTDSQYAELQWYVRRHSVYIIREVEKYSVDLAIGSSGTIENLAQIAARALDDGEDRTDYVLGRQDLKKVVKILCDLPLEERRDVPGINRHRADIIVAGAAIIDTLMQDLDVPEIQVSKRGLRDGMFVDYLSRTEHSYLVEQMSVRRRSVLQLGRACRFDEDHAQHIVDLSLQLFDSARKEGLHDMGSWERELLEYAALLHDIGGFLSYSDQTEHTYYIIGNADLLGFDQREITVMAMTARFHRRRRPRRRKDADFRALGPALQRTVSILSLLLSLAESLDRSHAGLVRGARVVVRDGRLVLRLLCEADCQLELWGVRGHERTVAKVLGKKLEIEVVREPQG
jgi:exopolyphosphatase/guanosine-5'-triphosphate,3'-diphosphate pyrophosphatase